MAFTLHSVWRRLQFANSVGVDHASVRGFSAESSTAKPSGWKPAERLNGNGQRAESSPVLGGRWVQICYALIDLFLVCMNGLIAFSLRFVPSAPKALFHEALWKTNQGFPTGRYGAFLLLYAVLILLFCQSQDLYRTVRTRTSKQEAFAILKAVFFATLLLSAFIYLSGIKILSRLVVGYAGALNALTLILWRLWKRKIVIHRAARGIGLRNVLIVGAGRVGQALAQYLEENKTLGYKVMGFLDANHSTDARLLGKIDELSRVARAEFADEVFITIPSERELVKSVTFEARRHGLNVKVIPELYDELGWDVPITHVGRFPVMELHWKPIPSFGLFAKRLIDIVGSTAALTVLSPVLVAIGVAIRLDSPGPALYRSPRVGKKGERFICYKFRTMVPEADVLKGQLRHLNEREGPTFKITNDPRITRLGKFLRKYSLDELPQLWNVLRGDMSLVGPRPHPLDDCQQYALDHLRRLEVKPGITGLWQVAARKHPSFDTNMRLDLEYIDNWNLWLDTKILLRTLPAALSGSGS